MSTPNGWGAHHGIYDGDGCADVDRLVTKLGGVVVYGDGGEALVVRERGDFTISLPTMTSARRDRFTVAHEIGHYFLHYLYPGRNGSTVFGRGSRNSIETQANVFAASLLMPAAEFRIAFAERGRDPWALASHFDVSPAAASVRMQVLGL